MLLPISNTAAVIAGLAILVVVVHITTIYLHRAITHGTVRYAPWLEGVMHYVLVIFTSINPIFLSSNNLVNMLFDCSTTGVIALGIVCVLMLGEIDLSVGSMSGVASALIGVLWVNGAFPLPLAVVTTLILGGVIGTIYALLRTRLGMPPLPTLPRAKGGFRTDRRRAFELMDADDQARVGAIFADEVARFGFTCA